jgi:acyl-CoA dehydrogenase
MIEQMDRLFEQQVTKDALTTADRGDWSAALWNAVSEAGIPHAMVAESAGGLGLAPADAMSLMRRMGYYALPLPLAETMIANHLFVETHGAPLDGPASFAPVNADDRIAVIFARDGTTLSGTAHHVPWGGDVENLVVFARDEKGKGYLARVQREAIATNQRRRNVAYEPRDNLTLDGIRLPLDAVAEAPDYLQADGLLPYVAAIRVQQMVGGMERALDYALVYANERVQFGRAIAKFQAIQHMLAIAAGHFAAACHQVHGAMGFTHEHALHFTTRRLWSWRDEGGSESYWQEWIGRKICAMGGEALWPAITGSRNL